jgi:hypothetical protein
LPWSRLSLAGDPERAFLTTAAEGAALLGCDPPQPATTRQAIRAENAIRMRTKRGTGVPVSIETQSPAAVGALIGDSELLKLAPPPLEMQGVSKRRQ